MKKLTVLLLQFTVMSFLTLGETILFYTKILMRAHYKDTFWTGILLGSLSIMLINEGIVLWINRHTKLCLNRGIVVVLSSIAASGLCFISAFLFDHHTIWDTIDFNQEIDWLLLLFFSFWVIFWSLIGGVTIYILHKVKH